MTLLRRGRNVRGRSTGFGGCLRCGDTWDWKQSHSTRYGNGRGCFPLCEDCWSSLTPDERLPYYESLWGQWVRQFSLIPDPDMRAAALADYTTAEHDAIMDAVRAGL